MSTTSIVKVSNLRNPLDSIVGQVIGRLTVLWERPVRRNGRTWLCRCACGRLILVNHYNLAKLHTQSCGCLKRDKTVRRFTTHGHSSDGHCSRTYIIWEAMKRRCYTPRQPNYARYGGRGITVCDKWRDSFEAFLGDMGECPQDYSIERIDNDGPYCKDNCRWATPTEQGNNKRNNVMLTHDGKTLTLAQWSRETGFDYKVLHSRLYALHWSPERALTQKPRICRKRPIVVS